MPPLPPQERRRLPLSSPMLAWCKHRVRQVFQFVRELRGAARSDVGEPGPPSGEAAELPRYSYDASLLFRRMATLQVDRDEIASDDPLLFREFQALCTLCRSKERCVLDLAQEGESGDGGWREYCLNATTLDALGAVQNCARAKQYLRTPRSTGFLANK